MKLKKYSNKSITSPNFCLACHIQNNANLLIFQFAFWLFKFQNIIFTDDLNTKLWLKTKNLLLP